MDVYTTVAPALKSPGFRQIQNHDGVKAFTQRDTAVMTSMRLVSDARCGRLAFDTKQEKNCCACSCLVLFTVATFPHVIATVVAALRLFLGSTALSRHVRPHAAQRTKQATAASKSIFPAAAGSSAGSTGTHRGAGVATPFQLSS